MQYNYSPISRYSKSGSILVLNPTDRVVKAQSGMTSAQLRDDATLRGLTAPILVAPTLTTVAPNTAVNGATNLTITCTGTGFVTGCVVLFSGAGLATTFVSATSVTAVIPTAMLTTAGARTVKVLNPGGAGSSNTVPFTIT
jgi:hypothetical protein